MNSNLRRAIPRCTAHTRTVPVPVTHPRARALHTSCVHVPWDAALLTFILSLFFFSRVLAAVSHPAPTLADAEHLGTYEAVMEDVNASDSAQALVTATNRIVNVPVPEEGFKKLCLARTPEQIER